MTPWWKLVWFLQRPRFSSGPTRWLHTLQRTWHPPLAPSGPRHPHHTTTCIQAKHKTSNNEPLRKQKIWSFKIFKIVFKIVHVYSKNANGWLSGRIKPSFSYSSSNLVYRENHSNVRIVLIANNFCIYKNVTFSFHADYNIFFSPSTPCIYETTLNIFSYQNIYMYCIL